MFSAVMLLISLVLDLVVEKLSGVSMILYGIAPYWKVEFLRQINSFPQFSLSFVEIRNTALQKCQMDANLRFFNNTTNMVVTRYLDCNFLERLNADNLFLWIRESISGLSESKFLQLFLDGSSVSWVVLDKLDDLLVENELRQFTLVVMSSTKSMAVFRPELLIPDGTKVKY